MYSKPTPTFAEITMIKILSTEQVRAADKATMEREPISSVDLMERAGSACADWITAHYSNDHPFIVLAGVGNNGGDALVVARRLIEKGYHVASYILCYAPDLSADLRHNLDRLTRMGHEVVFVSTEEQFPAIASEAVVIDGLLGSGLNRPAEKFLATCIEQLNASIAQVISIDIPSGLFADKPTPKESAVVRASHTLSLEVPKMAFLLPGADQWTGKVAIISIGLDEQFIAQAKSGLYLVNSVSEFAPAFARHKFDHKGKFGHALIVAGSMGKMGAAVLCARAALRSGCGLVTAHVPKCGYSIVQCAIPEAMCEVDEGEKYISGVGETHRYTTAGVGPGIGKHKRTRRMLKALLKGFDKPVVLDADALNILAEEPGSMEWLAPNSILTPHMKEFERLFGTSENEFDRIEKLCGMARQWQIFILLKGAHSALATPAGEVYFNNTGNPGMATGGSGDVLTGVITALLAQCKDPFTAALCGMYVHGFAGDLAAGERGQHGIIASDVIDKLGEAMRICFSFEA